MSVIALLLPETQEKQNKIRFLKRLCIINARSKKRRAYFLQCVLRYFAKFKDCFVLVQAKQFFGFREKNNLDLRKSMEAVLERKQNLKKKTVQPEEKTVGFFAGLFGCWHKQLSRPFTTHNGSYRVCLHCGARRKFDPQTLKTYGHFYFPLESGAVQIEQC
jgi:hypothetical protein